MKVANNHIIILPDKEISSWNGVELTGTKDAQRFRSVSGVVVATPAGLFYAGDALASFGTERPLSVLRDIRELNTFTTRHRSDLQVKPGDRVMFQYMAHSSPFVEIDGKRHIVVHYDMLIARMENFPVSDSSGEIFPLNNLLFVEFGERDGVEVIYDVNDYSKAKVIFSGTPIECLDGSLIDESIGAGDTVLFDKKYAARVEVDEFNSLNPGKQSSLFKVHRKYVTSTHGL